MKEEIEKPQRQISNFFPLIEYPFALSRSRGCPAQIPHESFLQLHKVLLLSYRQFYRRRIESGHDDCRWPLVQVYT